ncbi:tryptophan-rich sensory protein [Patescibacteria group bacterium]|nr:tryptophan-rich sensory protein [Patescibacteria group bacterium]MCL5409357.1 tryptophan-rich sensory protein [Patescibacteria group bacterium]
MSKKTKSNKRSEKFHVDRLIIAVGVCEVIGVLGSFFTAPAIPDWYQTLIKPIFTPPAVIFGPVWVSLFALMGYGLYLIWQKIEQRNIYKAVMVFILQLLVNLAWSIIFFGLRSPGVALVDILVLLTLIIITIYEFAKINQKAAWLLVPYFLWVSFATLLNYSIWQLNGY